MRKKLVFFPEYIALRISISNLLLESHSVYIVNFLKVILGVYMADISYQAKIKTKSLASFFDEEEQ